MYKYFFFFLLFIFLFGYNVKGKDVIELDNNSLVILKDDNNVSLLIKENNEFILMILSGSTNKFKYFTSDVDSILYLNNLDDVGNDNINIEKDNYVSINILNKSFCLYDYISSNGNDYSKCNYIYILNNTNKVYFKLNDDMNAIFYNEYSKFSNKFLEEMFSSWVDTYTVNSNEFIVIDFNYDYEVKNYSIKE